MKKQFLIMLIALGALFATNVMAKKPDQKSIKNLNYQKMSTAMKTDAYPIENPNEEFDAVYNAGTVTITGGTACEVIVEDANGTEITILQNYDGVYATISTSGWLTGTYYIKSKCDPRHGKYFIIYENNTAMTILVPTKKASWVLKI